MNPQEIQRIKEYQDLFDGDLRLGIAANIYGFGVVKRCAGLPSFADLEAISAIESEIATNEAETALQGQQLNSDDALKLEKAENSPIPVGSLNIEEDSPKVEELAKSDVSIATTEEVSGTLQDESEKTAFTDADILELILKANKENKTLGEVAAWAIYGEKAFDADGSFSAIVNVHKVAYVKGLITNLLNRSLETISTESETAKVEVANETPTDASSLAKVEITK